MGIDVNFGQRIKELMGKQAGTIKEEAQSIGYSLPGINKIFEKEDVSTSILKKLCKRYNLTLEYFLTSEGKSLVQVGHANIGQGGNIQYKGVSNVMGGDSIAESALKSENSRLMSENQLLKKQVELLEQMVEMLKVR